jgi:hypothetical protein
MIPRRLGYSNLSMLEYCESLRCIVSQKNEISVGRGKAVQKVLVNKYTTDQETIDNIESSCIHYKQLHDMEIQEVIIQGNVRFREYQTDIINKGADILLKHRFLYLAMEVRTGKTLTSLGIAEKLKVGTVLFITKKKAIGSILNDYNLLMPSFDICCINYESLHTIDQDLYWDLVICDESHVMSAFPTASNRASMVRDLIAKHDPMVVLMSGTPTPESYSQMYHQVYGIKGNPFSHYDNFYRFSDDYVKVVDKKINGFHIRDYSNASEDVIKKMEPYTINYTQQEAGFSAVTTEQVLEVELKESTYRLIKKLKSELVVEGKEEVILGDTAVKLMSKMHQLFSGTVKFESGNSMVIDLSKAEFIKKRFDGKKIGIFYKFKEELNALKQVFNDDLTTELGVFDDTDKNIALQIVSGREGISLKKADYLVFYNIDFSATSYWQAKDRMTTKDRLENEVFWIFAKGGIERMIYKAVTKKKDYTLRHFQNDFYL